GAMLGIGTISHYISAAALNQHVKKSGRTSGLTRSTVSGLNATVRVAFTNECHGGTYYKTFNGQIVANNPSSAFLRAGDSGSLLVEDGRNASESNWFAFCRQHLGGIRESNRAGAEFSRRQYGWELIRRRIHACAYRRIVA